MTRSIPQVVLASRNGKKCDEIRALVSSCGVQLIGLGDLDGGLEIVEDGASFAENAAKKAVQTAVHFGKWAIGEDSGLKVDALGGAPGIYSARYSGPEATDASNNAKLIRELDGVPPERRGAQYVCHVALADPDGNVRVSVEGTCRGRITSEPRGTNGFGYDPYFEIREYHRTFGELSPLVKRCLSHRARAFAKFIPLFVRVVSGGTSDL